MAFDPGAIDAALAAAVGDDASLAAELRDAFIESARAGARSLREADSVEGWRTAAWRLASLSASFGAVRLMALATVAADGPPHDAAVLRTIARAIDRL